MNRSCLQVWLFAVTAGVFASAPAGEFCHASALDGVMTREDDASLLSSQFAGGTTDWRFSGGMEAVEGVAATGSQSAGMDPLPPSGAVRLFGRDKTATFGATPVDAASFSWHAPGTAAEGAARSAPGASPMVNSSLPQKPQATLAPAAPSTVATAGVEQTGIVISDQVRVYLGLLSFGMLFIRPRR